MYDIVQQCQLNMIQTYDTAVQKQCAQLLVIFFTNYDVGIKRYVYSTVQLCIAIHTYVYMMIDYIGSVLLSRHSTL